MNTLWRAILRNRNLASVRIHRRPQKRSSNTSMQHGSNLSWIVSSPIKPYIHIIFRKECAEHWMTGYDSDIPKSPKDWLAVRGFANMEHFDVRVGVTA